jgi:hypothetical protein
MNIDASSSPSRPITPLHAIPYVHGSYASASPMFVRNSKFCHVLKRLLPSAYDELKSLIKQSNRSHAVPAPSTDRRDTASSPMSRNRIDPDPVKVMKWAENNPVVSAFGIWESDSGRRTCVYPTQQYSSNNNSNNNNEDDAFATNAQNAKTAFRRRRIIPPHDAYTTTFEIRPSHNKPALEWDVFLDPKLVRQVVNAMEVVESYECKLNYRRLRKQQRNNTNTNTGAQDEEYYDLHQSHTAAQIEVDRLVSQLMKRMILAHGSMSQLVLEAFGVAKDYNYKSVVRGARGTNVKSRGGYFWDEREEVRDYDLLLGKEDGVGSGKKTSFVGSRGIFMENW